jgi:hypothetical protein
MVIAVDIYIYWGKVKCDDFIIYWKMSLPHCWLDVW